MRLPLILAIILPLLVAAKKTEFQEQVLRYQAFIMNKCKKMKELKFNGKAVEKKDNEPIQIGQFERFFMGSNEGVEDFGTGAMWRLKVTPGQEYPAFKYMYNLVYWMEKSPNVRDNFSPFLGCWYTPKSTFGDDISAVMFASSESEHYDIGSNNYKLMKPRYKLYHFFKIAELFRDLYLQNYRNLRIRLKYLFENPDGQCSLSLHRLGELGNLMDGSLKSEDPQSAEYTETLDLEGNTKPELTTIRELRDVTLTPSLELVEKSDIYNLRVIFLQIMGVDLNEKTYGYCTVCNEACEADINKLVAEKTDVAGYEDIMKDTIFHVFKRDHPRVMNIANHIHPTTQMSYQVTIMYKCVRDEQLASYVYEEGQPNIFQPNGPAEMFLFLHDPGRKFDFEFLDRFMTALRQLKFIQNVPAILEKKLKANKELQHAIPTYQACYFDRTHLAVKYGLQAPGTFITSVLESPLAIKLAYLIELAMLIQTFHKSEFTFLNFDLEDLLLFQETNGSMNLVVRPEKLYEIIEVGEKPAKLDLQKYCKEAIKIVDAIPPETAAVCKGGKLKVTKDTEIWNFGRLAMKVLLPGAAAYRKNDNTFFKDSVNVIAGELKSDPLSVPISAVIKGCLVFEPSDRIKLQAVVTQLNKALALTAQQI